MADIEALGESIAALTKTIAARLREGNHPQPSFNADSPAKFPADIQQPRLQLLEALSDLVYLATGANDYLFLGGLFFVHDSTVMDVLNQFGFFTKVPLSGSASYAELAEATNIPEVLVRRVLRYAFTMHIFAPEAPGSDRIIHTAISAHAARTPVLRSWVGHHIEEGTPAACKTVEAIRLFSAGKPEPTEDLSETSFALSWPRKKDGGLADFWSVGQEDPKEAWRAKRFAEAMQASVLSASVQSDDVVDRFDWAGLGEATVVDVGGSDGALAAILARKHPNLRFFVQDLAQVEPEFHANSLSDVSDRVTFQAHDFFEEQTQHADVFLMKHVLHNWADKYAVQILRNLAAALNPGGRIIICDGVVPGQEEASSLPLNVRKAIAAADMHMFVMLNAAERTLDDWEVLAKKADKRFRVAKVHMVPGAIVSLLEMVLE